MLPWLLGLLAGPVHALEGACAPEIEDALRHTARPAAIQGPVVSQYCKAWPPSPGKVVAAVMAFEQNKTPYRQWVGVLALVDAQTYRVRNSHRFEIEGDAVTSVGDLSLTLDTANYAVAPGVRALGLRYSSSGPGASAATELSGDELTLFVPEGRHLRPVMGLSMSMSRALTGCLGSCPDAVWEDASRTVAIGPTGPQGWNDLRVITTVVRETRSDTPIDRTPQRKQQIYRYGGKRYELTSSQLDWDDYCCTIGGPQR